MTNAETKWLEEYRARYLDKGWTTLKTPEETKNWFENALYALLKTELYLPVDQLHIDYSKFYGNKNAEAAARLLMFQREEDCDISEWAQYMQDLVDALDLDLDVGEILTESEAHNPAEDGPPMFRHDGYFPLPLALEVKRRFEVINPETGKGRTHDLNEAPGLFIETLKRHLHMVFAIPQDELEALNQEDFGRLLKDPVATLAARKFVFSGPDLGFYNIDACGSALIYNNPEIIRMLDAIGSALGLVEFEHEAEFPNRLRDANPNEPDAHHRGDRIMVNNVMPADLADHIASINRYVDEAPPPRQETLVRVQHAILQALKAAGYNVTRDSFGKVSTESFTHDQWQSLFINPLAQAYCQNICAPETIYESRISYEDAVDAVASKLGLEPVPDTEVRPSGTLLRLVTPTSSVSKNA